MEDGNSLQYFLLQLEILCQLFLIKWFLRDLSLLGREDNFYVQDVQSHLTNCLAHDFMMYESLHIVF